MPSPVFILAIIALILAVLSLTPWGSHPALLAVSAICLSIAIMVGAKGG